MITIRRTDSLDIHAADTQGRSPRMVARTLLGLLVYLTVFCILPGCATIGQEFNVAAVDQIIIGQTTRADVERMFGSPWRVGVEDGNPTWTYGYYKYKLFGRAKTRDLVIRFDDKNVVRSFTFNTTEREDRPQQ